MLRPRPVTAVALISAVWLLHAAAPSAHERSASYSRLVLDGSDVRVSLTLNLLDLHAGPVVDSDGDEFISVDEIDERIDAVYQAIKSHYRLRAPDEPTASMLERYALVDSSVLTMEVLHRFRQNITHLAIASTLPSITQPNHQHLVRIDHDGGPVQMALLDLTQPVAALQGVGRTTGWQTVQSLLRANSQLTAVSLLIITLGLSWTARRVLLL